MEFLKALIAPFVIVKREKLYIGWVFYTLIFGLINLIADFLMGNLENVDEYIKTGQFYTFSIALVSPFIIEILLGILVERRLTKKVHFLRYKIPCILISVILIILITFLWIGNYKSSVVIQFFCTLFSLILSYYMFLISHMQEHNAITQIYDDTEYLNEERERMQNVQEKAAEDIQLQVKGEEINI